MSTLTNGKFVVTREIVEQMKQDFLESEKLTDPITIEARKTVEKIIESIANLENVDESFIRGFIQGAQNFAVLADSFRLIDYHNELVNYLGVEIFRYGLRKLVALEQVNA